MTDRNTNKLILPACLLFGGWMLIHFDAMEGLNNATNGVFYKTTAETERMYREARDQDERRELAYMYERDQNLYENGLITMAEVLRRKQKREDDCRMERLLKDRKP